MRTTCEDALLTERNVTQPLRLEVQQLRADYRNATEMLARAGRNATDLAALVVKLRRRKEALEEELNETLTALADAARRLAKAHVIEYCRWDRVDEDTRPKLHRAAKLLLTVDFVSVRPGVKIELKPDFATALHIAKSRAFPATA